VKGRDTVGVVSPEISGNSFQSYRKFPWELLNGWFRCFEVMCYYSISN